MRPAAARGRPLDQLAELREHEARHGAGLDAMPERGLGLIIVVGGPDGVRRRHFAPAGHERLGPFALAGRDLLHAAARGDGNVVVFQEAVMVAFALQAVVRLDQQPVGALGALAILVETHKMPGALHPFASEDGGQMALLELLGDAEAPLRRPVTTVPQHHRAAAVLALRDRAFKVSIIEGMVLDFDRQAPLVRIERRPPCHRPGLEHALVFEPQVVVQARGGVFLDNETQAFGRRDRRLAARLGGQGEVTLRLIGIQLAIGHGLPPQSQYAGHSQGSSPRLGRLDRDQATALA